jgi:predicted translin family RNA/ssDNA-binding protein
MPHPYTDSLPKTTITNDEIKKRIESSYIFNKIHLDRQYREKRLMVAIKIFSQSEDVISALKNADALIKQNEEMEIPEAVNALHHLATKPFVIDKEYNGHDDDAY